MQTWWLPIGSRCWARFERLGRTPPLPFAPTLWSRDWVRAARNRKGLERRMVCGGKGRGGGGGWCFGGPRSLLACFGRLSGGYSCVFVSLPLGGGLFCWRAPLQRKGLGALTARACSRATLLLQPRRPLRVRNRLRRASPTRGFMHSKASSVQWRGLWRVRGGGSA